MFVSYIYPRCFYSLLIWDVLADVLKARLKTTGVVEHTFLALIEVFPGVFMTLGGQEANVPLGPLTLSTVNLVASSVGYPLMWLSQSMPLSSLRPYRHSTR